MKNETFKKKYILRDSEEKRKYKYTVLWAILNPWFKGTKMKTIHVTYENIQITVNETDTTLVKLLFSENNKFLVVGSKSKTHYNT